MAKRMTSDELAAQLRKLSERLAVIADLPSRSAIRDAQAVVARDIRRLAMRLELEREAL